jgi:hypothetical protein
MKCPGCGAAVEDGADLCLECGEPMGDTPAAKIARAESAAKGDSAKGDSANVIRPPADVFKKTVSPPTKPAATAPAKPTKKWRDEEPEPRRCPGCGTKSFAARCPGCGTKLIHDDE